MKSFGTSKKVGISCGGRGVAGLPQDAAARLATDDVRAESPDPGPAGAPGAKGPGGARRLASALRSQPLSINFRAADGSLTEQLCCIPGDF